MLHLLSSERAERVKGERWLRAGRGDSFFNVWGWRQKKGGQCGTVPPGTSGVHAVVSTQSTWTQSIIRPASKTSLAKTPSVLPPTTRRCTSSSNLLPLFTKKTQQKNALSGSIFFCSLFLLTFRVCISYKAHVHIPEIKCETQGCSRIRNNQNIQMASPRFIAPLHVWPSTRRLFSWLSTHFETPEEPPLNAALVKGALIVFLIQEEAWEFWVFKLRRWCATRAKVSAARSRLNDECDFKGKKGARVFSAPSRRRPRKSGERGHANLLSTSFTCCGYSL